MRAPLNPGASCPAIRCRRSSLLTSFMARRPLEALLTHPIEVKGRVDRYFLALQMITSRQVIDDRQAGNVLQRVRDTDVATISSDDQRDLRLPVNAPRVARQ